MGGSSRNPPNDSLGEKQQASPVNSSAQTLDSQSESAPHKTEKEEAIRRACDLRDFDGLVSYATSEGGFLNDDLRRLAWPILLRCDTDVEDSEFVSWEDLPSHKDEDQVQLDVNRSFVYYPQCAEDELSSKKDELSVLIRKGLRKYPMLCYFQGYHDIVQVLLLVLGGQQAVPAVTQISLFRIRDYMLPSLSPALKHLQLIPAIIEKADPALREHLAEIRPFFALAATLTLYAHDIQEYSDIARLFDFLLATEPVISIYLFAAIILSREKELLEIPVDEPEMLHFTLSKLPQPLNLDGLISHAMQLFNEYPPESLPFGAWKKISQNSVLKSSRDPFATQTREEAVRLFEKQTRELQNEELKEKALAFLWSNRRTIGSVVVTIFIGAVSIWIKRKGFDTPVWASLARFKSALHRYGWL
ncbi:TBC domain-containing protein [Aspergillus clavatus NRRL 1]|uniref:TBC domain protein, putative n=1 Tax=Aspergillus clavatus (strain ATCC 1007 / CBS 513.65 / DSM 816 / NCTC 3887 / NRRL 1 / QM 1276 / 107) TaxID=344612 RepID=A1CRQ6_ASPCL|nr:TBC domain protein, putative [Aspergillus clavatus NRRL 1]EAW08327.1 TBC domain protein, putative [Aspergillus clavatus NRRL 1]